MPHRPAHEMFGKRAVIITQCLGAGAKSAARDIKHSLSWCGISKIGVFAGALMGDIAWERLSEKKRAQLTRKVKGLSQKFMHIDYTKPARTNSITKAKFLSADLCSEHCIKETLNILTGSIGQRKAGLTKPDRGSDGRKTILLKLLDSIAVLH